MSNQVFFFGSQSALNEWMKSENYETRCRTFCEESGRTEAEFLKALKIEMPLQLSFEGYAEIFNDFMKRASATEAEKAQDGIKEIVVIGHDSTVKEWMISKTAKAFLAQTGLSDYELSAQLYGAMQPNAPRDHLREKLLQLAEVVKHRKIDVSPTLPYEKFLEPNHDKTTLKRKKHRKNWR